MPFTQLNVYLILGISQYIDISIYRNSHRIYIVSLYEMYLAIYRNFFFF